MVNEPGRPKEVPRASTVQVVVDWDVKEILEKIAEREKTTVSKLLRPKLEEYAKIHASGNPAYPLDAWQDRPEMLALPTPYEDPTPDKIDMLSKEDAKFMVKQFSKWYPELQRKAKGRA